MALKIRLARGGAKKRPFYRIVVADSRSPRDGRFIEKIGRYNPLASKDGDQRVILDIGAAKSWLDKGARPTDRVARFMATIHYREIPATEYEALQAAAAEGGDEDKSLPAAYASANEGMVLVAASDAESDAKQLFGWTHGNNPEKGKPGQKALERIEEKKEKEAARKEAEEEAKREAEEAAKAAAEAAAAAEAEAKAAAEAPADGAEDAPAEDTPAEDKAEG